MTLQKTAGTPRDLFRFFFACALFVASSIGALPVCGQEEQTPERETSTLHLAVFGNVDFIAKPARGDAASAVIGPFDLYLTGQISDHWSSLGEVVLESTPEGELVTDFERFLIIYTPGDRLRLSAGRSHNPIVRWNESQHHGLFVQTPMERPLMARYEDSPGLWPVHFVGVRGEVHLSALRFEAGVGNGRGAIADFIQTTGDIDRNKALIFGLRLTPGSIPGLELAATTYLDRIPDSRGSIKERDITLSANYYAHGFDIRGEWGVMKHSRGRDRYETRGAYVLVSKSLGGAFDRFKPYVMFDDLKVADDESFFADGQTTREVVWGGRLDVHEGVALKGEFVSRKVPRETKDSLVRFQLAVTF